LLSVRARVTLNENILTKVLLFNGLVVIIVLDNIGQGTNRGRDKLRQILVKVLLKFVANNSEFRFVIQTETILELPVPA
jgi:hypothetical protein